MKKALIVLALVVLALVPVMAKSATAIGGEAGYPASGVTINFDLKDNIDGFATVGFWYEGGLEALVGGQVKVADIKIDKAKFFVSVGAEAGALISFKDGVSTKVVVAATGSFNYNFTVDNKADFRVYLRLGPGVSFKFNSDGTKIAPDFIGALGLVYYL